MKDLGRHIEYLLCEHDSVAIPGIGTFITESLPARFYTEENIYLPPVRSVRLDECQKHNDGKLETCLVQLHHVTRHVAQKWVTDYVNNINQSLIELGFIDIGTIGRLTYIDENVSFDVCEAGVNSPDFYGLDSFQMSKLPAYAHKSKEYKDSTHFTIRLRRSTVHRVMTAAAMIIVALTVIVPNYGAFNFNNKLQSHFASAESLLTLFNANPQPIAHPASEHEAIVLEQQSDTPTALIVETEIAIDSVLVTTNDMESEIESLTDNSKTNITQTKTIDTNESKSPSVVEGYCIVMASAITHKGAEHLINKLNEEGFTNVVKYDDNGMLRVLLVGYDNEQDARTDMSIVRTTDELYSGSWLKFFQ